LLNLGHINVLRLVVWHTWFTAALQKNKVAQLSAIDSTSGRGCEMKTYAR
jgi:hypothetical protein